MTLPLVSIILPTYNRAYCLAAVIDTVLGQGYPDLEVIVVDDGSTDDTEAVVRARYGQDGRIRYSRQPNAGASAARNAAMAQARGEVLVFCDSDDLWLPHRLRLTMAAFGYFPEANLLWTDLSAVDPEGRVLHERYTRVCYPAWRELPMERLFPNSGRVTSLCPGIEGVAEDARAWAGDIFITMLTGTLINMPTVAVRRALVERIGGFNVTMKTGEDYDFNLRACNVGPVVFVDVPTVLYRIGAADQLTRPSLHADQARNYFRAVAPFFAGGMGARTLSPQTRRRVLAGKYRWLAESELGCGNRAAARTAYFKSIRNGGVGLRTIGQLASTLLPESLGAPLRAVYRRAKSLRRRAAQLRKLTPATRD